MCEITKLQIKFYVHSPFSHEFSHLCHEPITIRFNFTSISDSNFNNSLILVTTPLLTLASSNARYGQFSVSTNTASPSSGEY